jgi:cytochrome c553
MIGIRQSSLLVLLALVSMSAGARASGDFLDLRDLPAINGDAEAGKARATTCMGCHGERGVAPVPLFPNLAGQHAEYLYGELLQIRREGRPDSPMTAQVADLDDATLRDLAAWFASLALPTAPAAADAHESHEVGRRLYREGDPARGIPPCQGCHGAGGAGHALSDSTPRWRTVPILSGQHAAYLAQRLRDYRDGRHSDSSSARVMSPIAATLDDAAIDAIAQWIGSGAH